MRLRNIPGAKDAIASSKYVVQEPEKQKGAWSQVFGNQNPVHIEVGMGKGRFIMDMAEKHPEINYVGIEMYDSVLLRALQKMEEREHAGTLPENLVFLRMDARTLPLVFEKGEEKFI
jgi:tRNA (guanine-N7-)-methyltransferase